MNFYTNFLMFCNSVGKTPSRVVLEIGLKKSAVTRWKAGGMPTDATLARIADYFGITVPELLSDNKNKPDPVTGNELDIEMIINNMTREQLVDFIMAATARLRDME